MQNIQSRPETGNAPAPRPLPSRRYDGFTLIELLVTMGIIVVLIAILLPTISRVRKTAAVADTSNEISSLASSIQAYYGDFHAYPGPFSENQIDASTTYPLTVPATNPNLIDVTGGQNAQITSVTSSENLVLGLSGGLNVTFSNGTANSFNYNAANVLNSGPAVLNTLVNAQKQISAYYTPKSTELPPVAGNGEYSKWGANDSQIPEYLDHIAGDIATTPTSDTTFPATTYNTGGANNFSYGVILYLRARTGVSGPQGGTYNGFPNSNYCWIVNESKATDYVAAGAATNFQYNFNQLTPYGFVSVDAADFPVVPNPTSGGSPTSLDPIQSYFSNPNIWNTPRGKDQFILISAGTDRIFGTADDIVFGN